MKDKVRPIYRDLQGYLSQLPLSGQHNDVIRDPDLWNNYNSLVEELKTITSKDYNSFRVEPKYDDFSQKVFLVTLRTNLGRLISRLHAEFFDDEQTPFSSSPSTIINQSQSQEQSIDLKFYIDLGSKLDEKIKNVTDEKEKGYLEKFKNLLPSLKSGMDILKTSIDLAKEFGLTPDQVSNLLH